MRLESIRFFSNVKNGVGVSSSVLIADASVSRYNGLVRAWSWGLAKLEKWIESTELI